MESEKVEYKQEVETLQRRLKCVAPIPVVVFFLYFINYNILFTSLVSPNRLFVHVRVPVYSCCWVLS